MGKHDSNLSMRQVINLAPAKYQWQRTARLAIDVSQTDNLTLHREAIRITTAAIDRIATLVEEAARQTGA